MIGGSLNRVLTESCSGDPLESLGYDIEFCGAEERSRGTKTWLFLVQGRLVELSRSAMDGSQPFSLNTRRIPLPAGFERDSLFTRIGDVDVDGDWDVACLAKARDGFSDSGRKIVVLRRGDFRKLLDREIHNDGTHAARPIVASGEWPDCTGTDGVLVLTSRSICCYSRDLRRELWEYRIPDAGGVTLGALPICSNPTEFAVQTTRGLRRVSASREDLLVYKADWISGLVDACVIPDCDSDGFFDVIATCKTPGAPRLAIISSRSGAALATVETSDFGQMGIHTLGSSATILIDASRSVELLVVAREDAQASAKLVHIRIPLGRRNGEDK